MALIWLGDDLDLNLDGAAWQAGLTPDGLLSRRRIADGATPLCGGVYAGWGAFRLTELVHGLIVRSAKEITGKWKRFVSYRMRNFRLTTAGVNS
jgi:hypothetical protein